MNNGALTYVGSMLKRSAGSRLHIGGPRPCCCFAYVLREASNISSTAGVSPSSMPIQQANPRPFLFCFVYVVFVVVWLCLIMFNTGLWTLDFNQHACAH